jgi:hypothetical protein
MTSLIRRKNIQKPPCEEIAFPPSSEIVKNVEVPYDLLNIPYSKVVHKAYPEIRSNLGNSNYDDLKIYFQIHHYVLSSKIGPTKITANIPKLNYEITEKYFQETPIINSTSISVMEIYRNYGLNVTIAFLRRLAQNPTTKSDKVAISVYFAINLVAITGDKELYEKNKCGSRSPIPFLIELTNLLVEIVGVKS